MPVWPKAQPAPVALGLLLLEWTLLTGEVRPAQRRCGARDALLEGQPRPHDQRMHRRAPLGRLHWISPQQEDLALATLHSPQGSFPVAEVHGKGLVAGLHHPAPHELGRRVCDHNVAGLLAQGELLPLPRGLVAVELAPGNHHHATVLLLGEPLNSALAGLRPEGQRAAAHHRDRLVLLHVSKLLDQAVRLRLVVCVEAHDELAAAAAPALAERASYSLLHAVLHDLHMGLIRC
mmetsp:Transcript_48328/g.124736  ORF Transcript_48328/g.124736 Transcript_48328/m.124736 type:complete len:234 (+) Transcript_48328:478-1179(+)